MALNVDSLSAPFSATQSFTVTGTAGDTVTASVSGSEFSVSPASATLTSGGVTFTASRVGSTGGAGTLTFTDTTDGESIPVTLNFAGDPVVSPTSITGPVGQIIFLTVTETNDPNAFTTLDVTNTAIAQSTTTSNAEGKAAVTITLETIGSTAFNVDDGHGGTLTVPITVLDPVLPPQVTYAPDVRITVYDPKGNLLELDASSDVGYTGIVYNDAQNGPDACTIELAEYYEDVIDEGVWTARNIVEISVADDELQSPVSAGDTKVYVGSRGGYDPLVGHDTQQIYLYDGTNLAMRLPVTLVGTDSGGDYLELGASIPYAFARGTLIGRRRYAGYIVKRELANSREPHQTITCQGIYNRLADFNDSFTATNYDVGLSIYAVLSKLAADCPELSIIQSNFPTIGMTYTGTRERSSVDQIVAEILTGVDNGDQWVLRVGHDRIVRLIKLYDSATDTYTYNVTIPQNNAFFLVGNVKNVDQDAQQMFNWIEVIGDTDPITKQPVRAIVVDSIDDSGNPVAGSSYALYGKIEGNPVTNNALKDVDACASYGRGLLNEFSLPRQNSSFTLYTRNRGTGTAPVYSSSVPTASFTGKWWNQSYPSGGGDLPGTPDATSASNQIDYTRTDSGANYPAGVTLTGEFYARFVGSFTAQQSGTGSIGIQANDGCNLYINGTLLVNKLGSQDAGSYESAPFTFVAGTTYSVIIEWSQIVAGSGDECVFGYEIPDGGTFTVIGPQNVSYPALNQGDVVLGVQNVILTGFDSPAPNLYGLCQVAQSSVLPGRNKLQQITFSAVEPDHNAVALEHAYALATASRQNTSPPAYLTQYCVSANAFDFSPDVPFSGFTVTLPLFNAIFARPPGSAQGTVVECGGVTLTLTASATNYVYLTADKSFHIVTNDPTPVANAIFYGIFQTDASNTIGFWAKASVGVNLPNPANLPGGFTGNLIPDAGWLNSTYNPADSGHLYPWASGNPSPDWSFAWFDTKSFWLVLAPDGYGALGLRNEGGRNCMSVSDTITIAGATGDFTLSFDSDTSGTINQMTEKTTGTMPSWSIIVDQEPGVAGAATNIASWTSIDRLFTISADSDSNQTGANRAQDTWTNDDSTLIHIRVLFESNGAGGQYYTSKPQLEPGDQMTAFKPTSTTPAGSTASTSSTSSRTTTSTLQASVQSGTPSAEVVIGDTSIIAGNGAPGDIARPKGSLYLEDDTPNIWQSLGESTSPTAGFVDDPQYVSGTGDVVLYPTSTPQVGDVLLFIGSGVAFPGTVSSDWTQIISANSGSGYDGAQAAYHIVGSADSAPFIAIAQAALSNWCGVLYHLTNTAAAAFIDASEAAVNQTAPYSDTSLTTAGTNELALSFVSAGRIVITQSSVTSAAGFVQDLLNVDTAYSRTIVSAHKRISSLGTSAANTTTLDAGATNVVSVLILIKPGTGTSNIGSWQQTGGSGVSSLDGKTGPLTITPGSGITVDDSTPGEIIVSASGGTVSSALPLVNGDTPGPGVMADANGQCIAVFL